VTKQEFVAQLERAVVITPHLPVTSAVLKHLAEALKAGDPPWWNSLDHAWEKRTFHSWTEPWWLFLTALHYEALSDDKSPLGPFFPSCGGTDEADPSKALAEFLKSAPRSFYTRLRESQRRTFGEVWATLPKHFFDKRQGYGEAWGPLWFRPASIFFGARKLPYYLVEINAGAGLNMAVDLTMPDPDLDSSLIAARIGIDPEPLQLEDVNHLRWLTAGIPPEQMPLIGVLDQLIETVKERQRQDAAFIQLVPCAAAAAPQFITKNVPSDDQDVGLLLLTVGATSQMGNAEYTKFGQGLLGTMAPWGSRALWVEFDKVREEMYSTTYQLRVHRVINGKAANAVIARFDMGMGQIRGEQQLRVAKEFLAV
jgi:hypothetical protein